MIPVTRVLLINFALTMTMIPMIPAIISLPPSLMASSLLDVMILYAPNKATTIPRAMMIGIKNPMMISIRSTAPSAHLVPVPSYTTFPLIPFKLSDRYWSALAADVYPNPSMEMLMSAIERHFLMVFMMVIGSD